MAVATPSQETIDKVQKSEVLVPWCDEFKNMICGLHFKAARSEVMLAHKIDVRKRLKSFNDDSLPDGCTLESLKCRRMAVAKSIFGHLGSSTNIEAPLFVTWGCNTFIGEDVYMNRNVSIYDTAPVHIGNRVLIAFDVRICTDTHEVDAAHRQDSDSGSFAKPISIGDDCWIGAGSYILPGITIGRGCTIAAGAVVAKDVDAHSLVGGVPAKLIRKLKGASTRCIIETSGGGIDLCAGNGGAYESTFGVCIERSLGQRGEPLCNVKLSRVVINGVS